MILGMRAGSATASIWSIWASTMMNPTTVMGCPVHGGDHPCGPIHRVTRDGWLRSGTQIVQADLGFPPKRGGIDYEE